MATALADQLMGRLGIRGVKHVSDPDPRQRASGSARGPGGSDTCLTPTHLSVPRDLHVQCPFRRPPG
jgi:hypothetical protein